MAIPLQRAESRNSFHYPPPEGGKVGVLETMNSRDLWKQVIYRAMSCQKQKDSTLNSLIFPFISYYLVEVTCVAIGVKFE